MLGYFRGTRHQFEAFYEHFDFLRRLRPARFNRSVSLTVGPGLITAVTSMGLAEHLSRNLLLYAKGLIRAARAGLHLKYLPIRSSERGQTMMAKLSCFLSFSCAVSLMANDLVWQHDSCLCIRFSASC